jgi:hypothetical protein
MAGNSGGLKLYGVPRCAEPRHAALHVRAALGTDLGTVDRLSGLDTSPTAAARQASLAPVRGADNVLATVPGTAPTSLRQPAAAPRTRQERPMPQGAPKSVRKYRPQVLVTARASLRVKSAVKKK